MSEKIKRGDQPRDSKIDKNTFGSPDTYKSLSHLTDAMDTLTKYQFYKLQKVIQKANMMILHLGSVRHFKTFCILWNLVRQDLLQDLANIADKVPKPAHSLAENFIKTKFKRTLEHRRKTVNKYGYFQYDVKTDSKTYRQQTDLPKSPIGEVLHGLKRLFSS